MPDREKVIKGLEYHLKELSVGKTCSECPYCGDNPCEIHLVCDAMELLKQPVKPGVEHSGGGSTWWHVCGACKTAINPNDKYCHECGVSIDWGRNDA